MLRPISRKYDRAEHTYPVELDTLAELIAQANAAQAGYDTSGPAETSAASVLPTAMSTAGAWRASSG